MITKDNYIYLQNTNMKAKKVKKYAMLQDTIQAMDTNTVLKLQTLFQIMIQFISQNEKSKEMVVGKMGCGDYLGIEITTLHVCCRGEF